MMRNLLHVVPGILLLLSVSFAVRAQNMSYNMSRVGSWVLNDTISYYNDVWGYANNKEEYAIIGSNHSTHFLNVTNPDNITEVASFVGAATDVIWRDFKTNGQYAYGVADGDTNNTLQIFYLGDLPSNVTKVYDSNEFTESTHNIFIDSDRLYLASNLRGGVNYALEILDISIPDSPSYIASIPSGLFLDHKVHDLYVRNDTAYCSGEYGGLFILDLTDPQNPSVISSILSYLDQGYNHSCWVSEDSKYLVMADEVPNSMALKLFDISDITNPMFVTTFRSNVGARPHNPFIKQNKVVVSYYSDGVYVFDIKNGSDITNTAFYDTYPDNDTLADPYPDKFDGCWGVYLFLPSGRILASDDKYGLFVLSTPEILNVKEAVESEALITIKKENRTIHLAGKRAIGFIGVYDSMGKQLFEKDEKSTKSSINLDSFSPGVYYLTVGDINNKVTEKIVIR